MLNNILQIIEANTLLLARLQFAFTMSFHIIFPAFTIGLACFLAFVEWQWLKTGNSLYHNIYRFWVKIFAITFAMGVVSGVVLSYQIGTNWSAFSDKIGNVLGPLFTFEVLTAFFLEASFLGIMLFGWGRVSLRMHFISTVVVALGTLISAFWILSVNSWMQTPQGFEILTDGTLNPVNWIDIIFNPSFPYRYAHMITASFLTSAFVIGGVGSFYLQKNVYIKQAKIMLKIATITVAILAPTQIILGDLHGLNTLKYQPAKIAAMEGIWNTERGVGLLLFALPDQQLEMNHFEIKIPNLGSLILTHDLHGEIKGLKEWNKKDRPPVKLVFWSFRVMVGLGILMSLIGIVSATQYLRQKFLNTFLLRLWILMIPSGFVAILAGWCVTEIGRQPYTVYNLIRTSTSVSPAIIGPQIAWSLLTFIVMYILVFCTASYYILKLINKGMKISEEQNLYYGHGVESIILKIHKKEGKHV